MLRGQKLGEFVGQSRLYTANNRTEEMGIAVVGYRHAWLGSFERRRLVAGGGAAGCLWGCCFVLASFPWFVLFVQLQRALHCATHGVAGVTMVSLARCRLFPKLWLVVLPRLSFHPPFLLPPSLLPPSFSRFYPRGLSSFSFTSISPSSFHPSSFHPYPFALPPSTFHSCTYLAHIYFTNPRRFGFSEERLAPLGIAK